MADEIPRKNRVFVSCLIMELSGSVADWDGTGSYPDQWYSIKYQPNIYSEAGIASVGGSLSVGGATITPRISEDEMSVEFDIEITASSSYDSFATTINSLVVTTKSIPEEGFISSSRILAVRCIYLPIHYALGPTLFEFTHGESAEMAPTLTQYSDWGPYVRDHSHGRVHLLPNFFIELAGQDTFSGLSLLDPPPPTTAAYPVYFNGTVLQEGLGFVWARDGYNRDSDHVRDVRIALLGSWAAVRIRRCPINLFQPVSVFDAECTQDANSGDAFELHTLIGQGWRGVFNLSGGIWSASNEPWNKPGMMDTTVFRFDGTNRWIIEDTWSYTGGGTETNVYSGPFVESAMRGDFPLASQLPEDFNKFYFHRKEYLYVEDLGYLFLFKTIKRTINEIEVDIKVYLARGYSDHFDVILIYKNPEDEFKWYRYPEDILYGSGLLTEIPMNRTCLCLQMPTTEDLFCQSELELSGKESVGEIAPGEKVPISMQMALHGDINNPVFAGFAPDKWYTFRKNAMSFAYSHMLKSSSITCFANWTGSRSFPWSNLFFVGHGSTNYATGSVTGSNYSIGDSPLYKVREGVYHNFTEDAEGSVFSFSFHNNVGKEIAYHGAEYELWYDEYTYIQNVVPEFYAVAMVNGLLFPYKHSGGGLVISPAVYAHILGRGQVEFDRYQKYLFRTYYHGELYEDEDWSDTTHIVQEAQSMGTPLMLHNLETDELIPLGEDNGGVRITLFVGADSWRSTADESLPYQQIATGRNGNLIVEFTPLGEGLLRITKSGNYIPTETIEMDVGIENIVPIIVKTIKEITSVRCRNFIWYLYWDESEDWEESFEDFPVDAAAALKSLSRSRPGEYGDEGFAFMPEVLHYGWDEYNVRATINSSNVAFNTYLLQYYEGI